MGYDLARFTDAIDDNLVCAICSGVIDSAVTGCPNGHAFCASCLLKYKERGSKCPLCAVDIQRYHATPCLPLQNMIRALPVHCGRVDIAETGSEEAASSETTACNWAGPLDRLNDHDRDCGFVRILCAHPGCEHSCARRWMAAHSATCAFKPVKCKCGVEVAPFDLKRHKAEDCLEEPMDCIMCHIGCMARPKRREQAAHQVEAVKEHAALAAAIAERVAIAEFRLDLAGSWIPDEEQAVIIMMRIHQEADRGGEASRNDLNAYGALQLCLGLLKVRKLQ